MTIEFDDQGNPKRVAGEDAMQEISKILADRLKQELRRPSPIACPPSKWPARCNKETSQSLGSMKLMVKELRRHKQAYPHHNASVTTHKGLHHAWCETCCWNYVPLIMTYIPPEGSEK